jgi:hypothetical protein
MEGDKNEEEKRKKEEKIWGRKERARKMGRDEAEGRKEIRRDEEKGD